MQREEFTRKVHAVHSNAHVTDDGDKWVAEVNESFQFKNYKSSDHIRIFWNGEDAGRARGIEDQ